ncbi:MAG TPA: hypothetical protein VHM90_16050 [Phycisphaerae bacterium]|nr:hypothetical protein [Phycisphaerae bacterium]
MKGLRAVYLMLPLVAGALVVCAVIIETETGQPPSLAGAPQSATHPTTASSATATASAPPATLYDVTLFKGKPARGLGMRRDADIIYGNDGSVWKDQAKLSAVVQTMARNGARIIVIDNETGDLPELVRNVRWAKTAAPKVSIGVFGYPWYLFFRSAAENQAVNDSRRSLLDLLDVALPNSYSVFGIHSPATFKQWDDWLIQTIKECERVMPGKPIYPFLQMYYPPESVSNQLELIESSYFLQQVRECLSRASGAMIWSGPLQWDEKSPWYHDLVKERFAQPDQTAPAPQTGSVPPQ